MTLAITGAAGFLGSAVARTLGGRLHLGPPGAPEVHDAEGLVADINDRAAMEALCTGADVVVHLAGPPSVAASFDDPVACLHAHAGGTSTVLQAAVSAGVRRLIYVSSAEVYGTPAANPVSEHAALRPRSPYGVAKQAAEGLLRLEADAGRIQVVVLRPFNVYGPGQRGGVVRHIVDAVRAGGDVPLFDARPVRDFVHLDDVVRAIGMAADATNGPGWQVLNVGSGQGVSIGDVARVALDEARSPGRVRPRDGTDRPLDIASLVADVTLAEHTLGFRARVSLTDGLRALVESP